MAADGTIIIKTDLDNAKLVKELEKAKGEVTKLEKELKSLNEQKNTLNEKSDGFQKNLDDVRAKIAGLTVKLREYKKVLDNSDPNKGIDTHTYMEALERQKEATEQMAAAQATAKELGDALEKSGKEAEDLDKKLTDAEEKLGAAKEKAGGLERKLVEASSASAKMRRTMANVDSVMKKVTDRMKSLARRVLIFSVLLSALRKVRDWMGEVIKSNSEASAALARLKGALLTLAQPLVSVIIPAFTAFVNVLTQVVSALAEIVSRLFGSTAKESAEAAKNLKDEQDALKGTGTAAKKAAAQLAAFDEINRLTSETASKSSGKIGADFGFFDSGLFSGLAADLALKIKNITLDWDKGRLGKNKDAWVTGLSAFLGAVIGTAFGGFAGGVIGLLLGLAIGLISCTWLDKLKNPSKAKSIAMIVLASLIGAALGAMFGGLHGGIIGLLLGASIGIVAVEFANGNFDTWNAKNTFVTVLGAILGAIIGAAFGGFVGGVIGLFLGAAITIKAVNWYKDLSTDDKIKFTAMITTALGFLIGSMFGGLAGGIIGIVLGLAIGLISITFDDAIDEATKKRAGALAKSLIYALMGAIIGFAFGFGVIGALVGGVLGLTFGLAIHWGDIKVDNIPTSKLKKATSFGGGGRASLTAQNGSGMGAIAIPQLAAGAVIPPNREFMAVLGDQKSGRNLEAPESLIRQIVREESGGGSGDVSGILYAILEAIRDGKVLSCDDKTLAAVVGRAQARQMRAKGGGSLVDVY